MRNGSATLGHRYKVDFTGIRTRGFRLRRNGRGTLVAIEDGRGAGVCDSGLRGDLGKAKTLAAFSIDRRLRRAGFDPTAS